MTLVVHVVVGPGQHGVVRHGLEVAAACGHRVVRSADPVTLAADIAGADVVHVPFTDRLFGDSIEAAVAAFDDLAATVAAAGAALSVTLHDLPHDDSDLQRRRRAGYRAVFGRARGVVVNSEVELALLTGDAEDAEGGGDLAHAGSVRMIRLPVFPRVMPAPRKRTAGLVLGVLGFVYPDRGYEDVMRAAPPGSVVRAVGQPATGHDHLVAELADFARTRDISFEVTGHVDEADLAAALADVDVPVAPNRRVTASASINTWAEHGRRVLVPDGPYTRELRRERPARLVTYGGVRELAAAIAAACDEPDSTWLPDDAVTGPAIAEVAADYHSHFLACRPARAVPVAGGWTVPGNRWDLLADRAPTTPPAVSVVVPYFRDQAGLDRLLAALAAQTHPAGRLQVIVADDGSPEPPVVPPDVRVVRQDDRGFRAAAARNMGAATADGDVLVFLDGDMVPEPEFVARLCALPAVSPDAVTVGRRRHGVLESWTAADVTRWAAGNGPAPESLPEPAWLSCAYAGSRDLLDADLRSYRFVISAVLALGRGLFAEVGGFDESFTRYGGEDWELAHRLWTAGAVLAHRPDAIAWHDGPDWAARTTSTERAADKAAESAALAEVLPDPIERGGGQRPAQWTQPAVIVRLSGTDVAGLRATVQSAAHVDCGFWHADPVIAAELVDIGVRSGEPAALLRARTGFRARVPVPADLRDLWQWCLLADRVGTVAAGSVQVASTRYVRRERRHGLPAGTLAGRHDRPWGVY